MKKKHIILISAFIVLVMSLFFSYTGWNSANPEKTCASCHEINPSLETWQVSAHREIECQECHGTAMSNGIHSFKEKTGMVFSHMGKEVRNENIKLSEEQVIEVMMRCVKCHQTEYTAWNSGGHSVTYSRIFLNEEHNSMERPYWDCFRCHGMHYEGSIYDMLDPVSTSGPWAIIDKGKEDDPVITCLACHQVHLENEVHGRPVAVNPGEIHYERMERHSGRKPEAGLYVRSDKIFLRADMLPEPEIFDGERKIRISPNPLQRICIQCHAPGYHHQAGSEDDRTPSGVHEGLACMACHDTHSNDAGNACIQCHPAISNCGLDHMTMNTSFYNPESPNNIHHVKCIDCHNPIPAPVIK